MPSCIAGIAGIAAKTLVTATPGTPPHIRHIQAPKPHSDTKAQRRYGSTCLRLYDTA